MNIRVERSGGFAGIRQTRSISSGELSGEEAKKMTDLVEAARFFELPEVLRSSTPGADRFQYNVSVETGDRKHAVQVDETALTDGLRALIGWLRRVAH